MTKGQSKTNKGTYEEWALGATAVRHIQTFCITADAFQNTVVFLISGEIEYIQVTVICRVKLSTHDICWLKWNYKRGF